MTYFIVNAQYDQCFTLFFKDELGYPNFYRITELLPSYNTHSDVVLVAPYTKTTPIIEKMREKIHTLGIKYQPFGEELETAFVFDLEGKCRVHPLFKTALEHAIKNF
jgi:hypothetical protein